MKNYREILPEFLAEVAEVTDLDTALRLAKELGGQRVYIARKPGAESLLVKAVGAEAAAKIAGLRMGEDVTVPNGRSKLRPLVRHFLETGETAQAIVRKLGCHRETIRRIKAETAQLDLFAMLGD